MKPFDAGQFRDWEEERTFPGELSIRHAQVEKRISVESATGSVRGRFSAFGSTLVSILSFDLKTSTDCQSCGRGEMISLYFNLGGTCLFDEDANPQVMTQGQHTVCYTPDFRQKLVLAPESGQVQLLEVHVPVSYYIQLFSGHSRIQDEFIEAILQNTPSRLRPGFMPMTLPMKWIVNTIKNNTRTQVFKRLFLEAKILELLMLQAEEAQVLNDSQGRVVNSAEREALQEAKAILERMLDKPPTIRHLARMVGVNEFSLKKGFKDVFHETIYGYVSKLKMEQARQMLLDGDKSISEVSSMAGYKNPQHFTAAFKKHFGVLPSKLRIESLVSDRIKGSSFL